MSPVTVFSLLKSGVILLFTLEFEKVVLIDGAFEIYAPFTVNKWRPVNL